MRFKGNQPLHESRRTDPDQEENRDAQGNKPDEFSTLEIMGDRERQRQDVDNSEELEQTAEDYWGRSEQQMDGAVPTDPPERDPLKHRDLNNPRRPPKHNI